MATIFTKVFGGPHAKNGSHVYNAKLMETTPNNAGFSMRTDVHANMKAGTGPYTFPIGVNASFK